MFVFCYFVAILIASTQTKLHFPAEKNDRLEVHCIEEYGKYCDGKLAGFKFNDGCRTCKCNKDSVLCKKGPCQFFTKLDQDALDYCDTILLKNKNAYKIYKQRQRKNSMRNKDLLKTDHSDVNIDSAPANHPQQKKMIDRAMIGALKKHIDEQIINDRNMAHNVMKVDPRSSEMAPLGLDAETLKSNLVEVDDYKKAFIQPARSIISDDRQGSLVQMRNVNGRTLNEAAHTNIQKTSYGILPVSQQQKQKQQQQIQQQQQRQQQQQQQHQPQQRQQQQQHQPQQQRSQKHDINRPEIGKINGNTISKSIGPIIHPPGLSMAVLSQTRTQQGHPPNMPQNMPLSGHVGGLPVSGIIQANGDIVSNSAGQNKQHNGLEMVSGPKPLNQDKPSSNMFQNMQVSGSIGGFPVVQPAMQGLSGPYIHQNGPSKSIISHMPLSQQQQQQQQPPQPPMQFIDKKQSNKFPKTGILIMDKPIDQHAANKLTFTLNGPQIQQQRRDLAHLQPNQKNLSPQLQHDSLPSSGVLHSYGSDIQPDMQNSRNQHVRDDSFIPMSNINVGNPEKAPFLHQNEPSHSNNLQIAPSDNKLLPLSSHYPFSEFGDKDGQQYFKLPSQQYDELKHLAEGSPFNDHARLDKMFGQNPQEFRGPHHQQQHPNWQPMDDNDNTNLPSTFNAGLELCRVNSDEMQQEYSPPFYDNEFYPGLSPMYYGPRPSVPPNPWNHNWQVSGGFFGGVPTYNGFPHNMNGQSMRKSRSKSEDVNSLLTRDSWKEVAVDAKEKYEKKLNTKKKEKEMSEKVKNLLELTKAAIRVLIRANQTESTTPDPVIDANASATDDANVPTITPKTEISQEVKDLTSIVDEMKEIVPTVEKLVKTDDDLKEVQIDEKGEKELVIKPSSIIMMSQFGDDNADETQGYSSDTNYKITALKEKLSKCKLYSESLLEALDGKQIQQFSAKSGAEPTDQFISLFSVLQPLI